MSRKKILYVTALYDGGIGRHVEALLAYFSREYEVALASPNPPPLPDGERYRIAYYNLLLGGRNVPFWDGGAMLRLVQLCREFQPALVHAHGFKASMLALPAAALCRCPAIVTVHNFPAYPAKSFLPESFFNGALRRFDPLVSRYITVSEALRHFLINCGIDAARIKTIYNGVPGVFGEPGFVPATMRTFRPPAIIHIGTAGRLVPQKGMDIFIQAAAKLASKYLRGRLLFFIAGEGPERENLEKLRNNLELCDLLFFKGKIHNMDAFFSGLDIFVLASRSEGLSFSLLEAAAARLPLVAAASGGIPEIISHGKTGLLVPPEDSEALAWVLGRLVDEPQTRIKLGTAALEEVKRRFTEKKMLAQTSSLYKEIFTAEKEREKGKISLVKQ
ncbi:MAG: glycosyltransferase family 4 protein [Bacillota bacterium]